MVPETASRTPLSPVQTVSSDEDASAERWHQWQLRNAETRRKDANRMRVVVTALFVALAAWLGITLLAPSLLP